MSKSSERWYHDPKTGLPTIRKHPDAREYLSPDEVKRMVAGQPDYGDYPVQDTCVECGAPWHRGPCVEISR